MIHGIRASVEASRSAVARRLVVAHAIGGVSGGLAVALCGWLALTPARTLVPVAWLKVLVLASALWACAADMGFVQMGRLNRQVPQSWYKRHGPLVAYAYYGAALGFGLASYIPYATFLLVVLVGGLLPLDVALFAGALFGLGRTGLVGPISLSGTVLNAFHSVMGGVYRRSQLLGAGLSLYLGITTVLAR